MAEDKSSQHKVALDVFAALNGLLGVAAGAFAAHSLRERLEPGALELIRTAAHYEMIHALAILALGAFAGARPNSRRFVKLSEWARISFAGGIVLFSGSLYVLGLSGVRWWGMVTPLGGICFLVGWFLSAMAFVAFRSAPAAGNE